MAIVLITHDLGVVAELADEVIVMYAGRIVERTDVKTLFANPQHPYTIGLLGSLPKLHLEQKRLAAIEGVVPSPLAFPQGCRFHPRCPFAEQACIAAEPELAPVAGRATGAAHVVACRRAPLDDLVA